MQQKLVECIPNFSEGKDQSVLDAIVNSIIDSGCNVLDASLDPSHNRSVVTFIGSPKDVAQAAFNASQKAVELIDMEKHSGEHPRIGAVDVIPFVPIQGVTMADCIQIAEQVGKRIGEELNIPVYLYAKAARRPERVRLPTVRKGEYEGLKKAIKSDPAREPDFGPGELHPSAGAVAVGARPALIAYNVNLDTKDVKIARSIARRIRESSGGFPHVQAKGITMGDTGLAQVTMNLLDYRTTSIEDVFSKIQEEAERKGVGIADSEIIGLIPLDALLDVAFARLKLEGFSRNRILDLITKN